MKQVLSMLTVGCGMRCEAVGWSCEDPSMVVADKPIGLSPGAKYGYTYDCVLRALADGWELIGPPTCDEWTNSEGTKIVQWDWWLQRDCR